MASSRAAASSARWSMATAAAAVPTSCSTGTLARPSRPVGPPARPRAPGQRPGGRPRNAEPLARYVRVGRPARRAAYLARTWSNVAESMTGSPGSFATTTPQCSRLPRLRSRSSSYAARGLHGCRAGRDPLPSRSSRSRPASRRQDTARDLAQMRDLGRRLVIPSGSHPNGRSARRPGRPRRCGLRRLPALDAVDSRSE